MQKTRSLVIFVAAAIVGCSSAPSSPAAEAELATEEQKAFYAIGNVLSRNLAQFNLTETELAALVTGLEDGVLEREARVDIQEYSEKVQEIAEERSAVTLAAETEVSNAFLAAAAGEEGVTKTESGLLYSEMSAGAGATPIPADNVSVHYHGTLTDGTVFDSSVERGEPVTFPLSRVIPCWTEGLQLMKVGAKSRFVCPSDIAYGDRGSPPKIKPGAVLVFEVELLSIAE